MVVPGRAAQEKRALDISFLVRSLKMISLSYYAPADAEHAEVLPFVSSLDLQHGWRMLLLDRASCQGLHIRAYSLQGCCSFAGSGPDPFVC